MENTSQEHNCFDELPAHPSLDMDDFTCSCGAVYKVEHDYTGDYDLVVWWEKR